MACVCGRGPLIAWSLRRSEDLSDRRTRSHFPHASAHRERLFRSGPEQHLTLERNRGPSVIGVRLSEAIGSGRLSETGTSLSSLLPLGRTIPPEAIDALKFALCLPPALAQRTLRERLMDTGGIATVLSDALRDVTVAGNRAL